MLGALSVALNASDVPNVLLDFPLGIRHFYTLRRLFFGVSLMRLIFSIACVIAIAGGVWYLWETNPNLRDMLSQYVENGEILTLEARYTPEQIMDSHRSELISDNGYTFQAPELKFHPYLLMEVKYIQPDKKTKEGVILWSMVDGEMVLDTQTWEKTHGFEDAILSDANRDDFKILNALAKFKGKTTVDQLQKELHVEPETLTPWIDNTRKKQLVVQKGAELQLHFQNPKILVTPQTKISQWLVTKPYIHAQRIPKKYSPTQIQGTARAAFGQDFMIRSVTEVFLPVYSIEVLNPDGSILTSFWNALNGQRITPKYLTLAQ